MIKLFMQKIKTICAKIFSNKKAKWILLAISLILIIIVIRSFLNKPRHIAVPGRPVEIADVIEKDVPVYLESFGNMTSPYNVDIKSQVTGQIMEVHFKEGDLVAKGAMLFTIDPSQYKAELDKAKASLAQDAADLKLKKDTLERNKKLFEKGLISKQDLEKYQTDVDSADAKLKLDKAEIDLAQINLDYCYIRSPIDGLVGKRQVDPGNIVQANTGPTLVNIKSIDPLYVDFTITEKKLDKIRQSMSKGKLKVEIIPEGKSSSGSYLGELQFLDNSVDNSTGTIFLRAIVSNTDNSLWVGQFVLVRLILATASNAFLVPAQAVRIGQKGQFLFTVTSDNKADLRIVTTGNRQDDYIVVESGIKAGERVVTAGQLGLAPGTPVTDVTQDNKK